MRMAKNVDQTSQDLPRTVSAEETREIEYFLFREARLLDTDQYDAWLEMLSEDIHYWMPVRENRRKADPMGAVTPHHMAFFDDDIVCLRRRVARFQQPSAWAEDPATRHTHVVSGVEVYAGEAPGTYAVHSTFINYRSRVEHDNDLLAGRREDIIRRENGKLKLVKRTILMTQSVLQAKNLNTFL
ncbi:MAG: 3-phenylpropionate/cinnamic acid dioxygenase subunit beta [Natronospirillum sp.]